MLNMFPEWSYLRGQKVQPGKSTALVTRSDLDLPFGIADVVFAEVDSKAFVVVLVNEKAYDLEDDFGRRVADGLLVDIRYLVVKMDLVQLVKNR